MRVSAACHGRHVGRLRWCISVTAAMALGFAAIARADEATFDRYGHRLYEEERYFDAATLFEDPAWRGAAYYRASQFGLAVQAFIEARDIESLYNLGNSFAHMNLYADALKAYHAVLSIDPEHRDARHNADVVYELMTRESAQTEGTVSDGGSSQERKGGKAESAADKPTGDTGEHEAENPEDGGKKTDQKPEKTANRSGKGADIQSAEGAKERDEKIERYAEDEILTSPERLTYATRQATEDWLNGIRDAPGEFLKRRFAYERWRREAAGETISKGGDEW